MGTKRLSSPAQLSISMVAPTSATSPDSAMTVSRGISVKTSRRMIETSQVTMKKATAPSSDFVPFSTGKTRLPYSVPASAAAVSDSVITAMGTMKNTDGSAPICRADSPARSPTACGTNSTATERAK